MSILNGIVVPILTPFDEQGELAEALVEPMIGYLAENGISSIFVGGSYGGFALLDLDERRRLNAASIETAQKHGVVTLVNCASSNLRDTVRMIQDAAEVGADAVCFMSPLYYSHSIYKETELLRYASSVVENSSVPVFMYNNPRTTGFNASVGFVNRLAEIGVSGIKDSSDSIERIVNMLHATAVLPMEFEYITGSSISLMVSLLLGSQSAMSGVAVAFPKINVSLYDAVYKNDRARAIACYDRISKIREIMTGYGSRPISFYSILRRMGLDAGYPREPWYPLEENKADEMYERLQDISAFSPI
jgi:dihydrodipicolinate synthase/N-acetylneuraminate lyase